MNSRCAKQHRSLAKVCKHSEVIAGCYDKADDTVRAHMRHPEIMPTPTVQQYNRTIQHFQSERLRRDYRDLADDLRYHALAGFFFDELYGPHDFDARDAGARRLGQFIHLLPGLRIQDLELVLELLDLTNQLDYELAQLLYCWHAPLPLNETIYEQAYRAANNYARRVQQLELIAATLHTMHRVARLPLIGLTLAQTRGLAMLVGLKELHSFLVSGYAVFARLDDIEPFCAAVSRRELIRLDRIYATTPQSAPSR